ncbi:hypothetical protein [Micromonospora sp. NBRC 101691]|uniref:hypothetical protein n=1 Tax=Micromonospora sp. NBRC 101691 TaxID=3032198 RepID=UPI0024A19EFE|nr:hypothetical protein [Micromonospora sp. NBRC 101691]GLY21716.1 hypothetical protein Misp04_14480 [Micromonospora sp. NBRC 101691]
MNRARIAGHIAGAVVFSGTWMAAVSLPAGSPGWRLLAGGLLPPAVALASLLLQASADRHLDRQAPPPGPRPAVVTPRRHPLPRPDRPVEVAR